MSSAEGSRKPCRTSDSLRALSAADIQMSFVGEIVKSTGRGGEYPNIVAWVDRFQARPAYKTALAKGGPYNMGPKT